MKTVELALSLDNNEARRWRLNGVLVLIVDGVVWHNIAPDEGLLSLVEPNNFKAVAGASADLILFAKDLDKVTSRLRKKKRWKTFSDYDKGLFTLLGFIHDGNNHPDWQDFFRYERGICKAPENLVQTVKGCPVCTEEKQKERRITKEREERRAQNAR